jgi:hypothetical protein
MDAAAIVADLTYINYAFNRDRSPHITPERWKRIYGPGAERMEARYHIDDRPRRTPR